MTHKHIPFGFLVTLCLAMSVVFFGCAGPKRARPTRSDRALAEATAAARTAFGQDRIDQAAALYKVALKRARALDKPSAIGEAAYNLSACLLRLHQYDRARVLLAEARHELARSDSPLADVLILQARAAHLAGDNSEVGAFIHQLREDPRAKPSAVHLCQAAVLEGQIACDDQDWVLATNLLQQAIDLLGLETDNLLQAQLTGLKARIAMGTRDFRTAAESWERQADLLRDAHQYRALSAVLAHAGDARAKLNEHRLAADRLYRAARCAAGWGETASATEWASAALAAARQADDAVLTKLAQSLLTEFSDDLP